MPTRLAGHTTPSRVATSDLMEALEQNELLQESFQAATAALLSLQAEDEGWTAINRLKGEDGFSLENIKEIAEMAELQTTGNPLLKRGLTLRTENVFGRGINFDGEVAPRFQKIIDKPLNQSSLFTAEAFTINEKEAFNKGNLFMAYDLVDKTFFPLPLSEIKDAATNPDIAQDVWYYQRSYTKTNPETNLGETEPTVEWYPVLERWEARGSKALAKTIAGSNVSDRFVVVDFKVNTSIGKVWGVPDVLAAMPYAWAHSEYIRDASKLLKALATIAWKVVAKSKAGAANAAGKVAVQKKAGSSAVMTEGSDIVAMPRSGQVNMRDGQAIAGYVASALGVSLIALLSDPGTASGSYGAAATLDGPSANSARSRQSLWIAFYNRIFRLMGVKEIIVTFPKLSEDPVYRQVQTMTLVRSAGGLHADEYRKAALDAMDITPLHDAPPTAEDYAQAQNALGYLQLLQKEEADAQAAALAATASASGVNSGQGQSGAAGEFSSGDNNARDQETTPGTGS